ncbi:MAG: hypothetical protein ACTSR7_17185 [Promethearchaeota archaeon]
MPEARDKKINIWNVYTAVNVYDGDFWEHHFCKHGTLLDKFHYN